MPFSGESKTLAAVLLLLTVGCAIRPHQSSVQFRYDTEAGRISEVDWSLTFQLDKEP
jgi:hypothetical protein